MRTGANNAGYDHSAEPSELEIVIALDQHLIPRFHQLLGKGVLLAVRIGASIEALLRRQLGLTTDYIEKRIPTVFLNGKAADDLGSPLADGSTIALSGAMPGLVGATMRRGSRYAPLRGGLQEAEAVPSMSGADGQAVLKLFNTAARDLGPRLLARGIRVREKDLAGFLAHQGDDFWAGCRSVVVDGEPRGQAALRASRWMNRRVFLKVYPG